MIRLLKLARLLRDPEKGCPWDKKQTMESFRKCLLEEADEVVAAIDKKDYDNLCEELGDTLFNIVFLINLAEEQKLFTMEEVIEKIYHKMIERHPHVFGDIEVNNAEEALQAFNNAKNKQLKKGKKMDREHAWQLLCRYTETDSLRKHALAVEAAMAACAAKFNQDPEKWKIVGLLHDMDYEKFPEQHPLKGINILKEQGYEEDIQKAILCHVKSTGFEPQTDMEKSLCAVDELCGFIVAVTLVRPSKKLAEVKVKSVKKKIKDKAFARAVDREELLRGPELLGTTLDDHILFVIDALKPIAEEIGI